MDRRKRILVLDFDQDLLITLERLLEDSGFSATSTWDVDEARALMETAGFDFFIVGHRPPKLNGHLLLADLRARGLKFGSVVLGALRHQDGYGNLIDRIRAFPCSRESAHAGLLDDEAAQSLWEVSHGR